MATNIVVPGWFDKLSGSHAMYTGLAKPQCGLATKRAHGKRERVVQHT